MDARERARLRLARRVMTALRHQDFRAALPGVTAEGERPVVVALPDDRMGMVFDRLQELRGPVNLFVQTDPGFALVLLEPAKRPEAREVPPDVCPIHEDTHVSMLLTLLREIGPITCHRVASDCTFELVDDGAAPVLIP